MTKLLKLFGENPTQKGFELSRNLGISAGGISIVLLVTILQFDKYDLELVIVAISLSVSLPFWVIYFGALEFFIYLGPEYFKYFPRVKDRISQMLQIAGLGLVVAIGALFWHISFWVGIVYIFSILIAINKVAIYSREFSSLLYDQAGNGNDA